MEFFFRQVRLFFFGFFFVSKVRHFLVVSSFRPSPPFWLYLSFVKHVSYLWLPLHFESSPFWLRLSFVKSFSYFWFFLCFQSQPFFGCVFLSSKSAILVVFSFSCAFVKPVSKFLFFLRFESLPFLLRLSLAKSPPFWLCLSFVKVHLIFGCVFLSSSPSHTFGYFFRLSPPSWLRLCWQVRRIGFVFSLFDLH
jgi:hypothetical protein